MSETKIYIITFHTEDFLGTYSARTIKTKSENVIEAINKIENNWEKDNKRVGVDFIYSEPEKC